MAEALHGELLGVVSTHLSFHDWRRAATVSRRWRAHVGCDRCGHALFVRDLATSGFLALPLAADAPPARTYHDLRVMLRRRLLVAGAVNVARWLPRVTPFDPMPPGGICYFSLLNCTGAPLVCRWVDYDGPLDRGAEDVVAPLNVAAGTDQILLPSTAEEFSAGVAGHYAHSTRTSHAFVVRSADAEGGAWAFLYQIRKPQGPSRPHALRVDSLDPLRVVELPCWCGETFNGRPYSHDPEHSRVQVGDRVYHFRKSRAMLLSESARPITQTGIREWIVETGWSTTFDAFVAGTT